MSTEGNILGVLARIPVDDLNAALPLYEGLSHAEPVRFEFGGVSLAWVGSFLLIQGGDDSVRERAATVLVRDATLVADQLTSAGGTVIDGPAPGPNGLRLVARHPDGAVLEYIERR